jgi:hypothetical protein
MISISTYERRHLAQHMDNNQLKPLQPIIMDNKRHIYTAYVNSKHREASYIAMRYPVGYSSPKLVCTYGLTDEAPEYTYVSAS